MKRIMFLIHALVACAMGVAQPSTLSIATEKTTSLIFPFAIRHVDRGTKDVLVQQVKEADNILLVKAASANFRETNLSVVTSDGSVYVFIVCYTNNPLNCLVQIPERNKVTVATYANGILDNVKTIRGGKDRKWEMEAEVIGIYIHDEVIYYQLRLRNISPLIYDIDLIRFFIADKKKGKRTAVQENEVVPVYMAGDTRQVKNGASSVIVVALDKFTIPDAKFFAIQVMEKNGGRHLLVKVNNSKIIRAIALPDLR